MLEIKIRDLIVPKEFVKYLSIAWNGDIEIHLSDPTKGEHQEDFDHWKNWCGRNHGKTVEDVAIGNHIFDEDFFHVKKTDVSELIKNKNEGHIQIVLIPKRGKAIEIEIENMTIPKEFVRIITFRDNGIEIRLEQPNNDTENFNTFVDTMALSGFHEGKIVDKVKLGKHLFENKTFRFSSNPDLKMPGVKPSTNVIFLTDNTD